MMSGRISGSPPVSASLPSLSPAPSLSSYRPHHPYQHPPHLPPLPLHPGLVRSTVYRNPYARPGARELADALRTQDDDHTVRNNMASYSWC